MSDNNFKDLNEEDVLDISQDEDQIKKDLKELEKESKNKPDEKKPNGNKPEDNKKPDEKKPEDPITSDFLYPEIDGNWLTKKFRSQLVQIGNNTNKIQAPDKKGDIEIIKNGMTLNVEKDGSMKFSRKKPWIDGGPWSSFKDNEDYIEIDKNGKLKFSFEIHGGNYSQMSGELQQLHEFISQNRTNPLVNFLTNFTEVRQVGNKYSVKPNKDVLEGINEFRKGQGAGKEGNKKGIDTDKILTGIVNRDVSQLKTNFNSVLPPIVNSEKNTKFNLTSAPKIIVSSKDDALENNLKKKYKEFGYRKIGEDNIFLVPTESGGRFSKNFIERIEKFKASLGSDNKNLVFIPISTNKNKEEIFGKLNDNIIKSYKDRQETLFDKKLNIITHTAKKIFTFGIGGKDDVVSNMPLIVNIDDKSQKDKYTEFCKGFLHEAHSQGKNYNSAYCDNIKKEYLEAYIECKNAIIKGKYDDFEKYRYKMMSMSSEVLLDATRENSDKNVKSLLNTISSVNTTMLDENAKGTFFENYDKLSKLLQASTEEMNKDAKIGGINKGGHIKSSRSDGGHQMCVQKNRFSPDRYSESIFTESNDDLKIKSGKNVDETKTITLTTYPDSVKDSGLVINMFGGTKDVTKKDAPSTDSFDKRHCPITLSTDDVKLISKIYHDNQDELLKKMTEKGVINLVDILAKATSEQKETGLIDRAKAGFDLAGVKHNITHSLNSEKANDTPTPKKWAPERKTPNTPDPTPKGKPLTPIAPKKPTSNEPRVNCGDSSFQLKDLLEYLGKSGEEGGHKFTGENAEALKEKAGEFLDGYSKENANKKQIFKEVSNWLLYDVKKEQQKDIANGLGKEKGGNSI